jgi:hypothetical protein
MCFNWQISLFTFCGSLLFALLLIYKGYKKYDIENKVSGIFFIFIALIQFMDFLLWIDIHNKLGINKVVTIFGPILNVCQPIILYLIKYFYYSLNISTFTSFDLFIVLLNIAYLLYFIIIYKKYLETSNLITGIVNNHLKWPWIEYFNPIFYLILFAINIFYLFDFRYASLFFTITYLFLYLSFLYFNYNIGELWCFFGAFIPLILYFSSYYIL